MFIFTCYDINRWKDNTIKLGGEAVLREMYEQFVFSEAGEVERVTQGTVCEVRI